jgi:NAD(P)-dependent dehydrogenase (short-subunit alcohol dehydrogenase family)
MLLEGRVALITGAGSGIGKAAALALAKEGARIGALGRTQSNVDEIVKAIQQAGGEAIPLVADVSKAGQVQSAVQKIIACWGRLDIVFANAGINGAAGPITEITPEDYDEIMDINLKGTFLTIKYSVPYLGKQGGSIIIDSSVNGTRMFSNTAGAVYGASKAGQSALGKMLALQLAQDHIRINMICPGYVESGIGRSGRHKRVYSVARNVRFPDGTIPLLHNHTGGGKPEQVAQLVLFLASDLSDFITGSEIHIDGGESLLEG